MGVLHYFLGVEVLSILTGLLTIFKYIYDLLEKTNMIGAKDVTPPMSNTQLLTLSDGSPLMDTTKYRQVIGALQYFPLTHPDISYSMNKLAQFMHNTTESY